MNNERLAQLFDINDEFGGMIEYLLEIGTITEQEYNDLIKAYDYCVSVLLKYSDG